MNEFRPLRNFVDRWLGPLKTLKPAAPTLPKIPQPSQATMKKPSVASPIKTYGSGEEPQGTVYNNMPISKERIQVVAQEAEIEAQAHEKEVSTPIRTFNQGTRTQFGATMGAFGLTPPSVTNAVQEWERRQRELFAPFKVGEIRSTSPIKTFKN